MRAWLHPLAFGVLLGLPLAPTPAAAQDAPPAAAEAQPSVSPADAGVEEIIVTITKRAESIQEVGGTIAAFGEETIRNANIENVGDLIGLLPNVQVKSEDTDVSIRGVARAAFDSQSPVAFHVNGIYHFNSLAYIGQFYDLENVQIALGPSGTLYGRNANGGAIDLTWRKPQSDWEAIGDVTWAPEFDNYQFRTAVNVPLSGVGNDLLNARFVLTREIQDGPLSNLADTERSSFGAKDDWNVRGFLRSEPTEDLSLELRARYHKGDRRLAGGVSLLPAGQAPVGVFPSFGGLPYDWAHGFTAFKNAFSLAVFGFPACPPVPVGPCFPQAVLEGLLVNGGGPIPPLVRDTEFFTPLPSSRFTGSQKEVYSRLFELGSGDLEMWDVDATVDWRLSELPLFGDVTLTLLAGHGRIVNEGLSDSDATDYGALDTISGQHPEDRTTFEVRAQSVNESWLNWTLGFFYVHNEITQSRDTLTPLTVSGASLTQDETGYAPFANVTLQPIDPIEIFLGVRWNHDEFLRTEDPNPTPFDPIALPFEDLENTFRETTLDASIKWFITEDHMIYAKWARGYKAGFKQVLPASGIGFPARAIQVSPEVIIATEIGLKTSWLDGRLQANGSAFHYDYTNLQVPIIQFTQILNTNAEAATVWGFELAVDAVPIEGWNNRIALGWLSAEFDEFCANDPLVNLTLSPPPPDPVCLAKQVGLSPQDRNLVGDTDLAGQTLEDSPEWKISLLSTYRFEIGSMGSITPTLEFTWTDDAYRRPFNTAIDIIEAYTKTDLRVRWEESENRFWVEAFGENLENNYVYPRGIAVALTGTAQGFGLLQPRVFGLRVGFNWSGAD